MTREHRAWEMLIRRLNHLNTFGGNRSEMEKTTRIVEQIWDDAGHEEGPEDPEFYPVENIGFESTGKAVMKHTKEPFAYASESNAKRIVACVNACEGITNDALEEGLIEEALVAYLGAYDRSTTWNGMKVWED